MNIVYQTTEKFLVGRTWGFENFFYILAFIIGVIFIISYSCFAIKTFILKDYSISFYIFVCVLFGVLATYCTIHSKPVYVEIPQYEIVLNENYDMKDFYDKYDVIDTRGEIFIVRDKGWEELVNNGNS